MGKPHALIIEDYEDQAFVFRKALETAGYEAEVIADGKEAAERLREAKPDLIILDLHIPRISGAKLLEQIEEDERLSDTTIFIATADDRLAQELRGRVKLVLLKPISYGQLNALAGRFLERGNKQAD